MTFTSAIKFNLNGRPVEIPGCSTSLTLLQYLRGSGLTGSKEGCAEGDCGACSVAIVDHDAEGHPFWRAINSCLTPVCLLHDREIVTVEGVACGGPLHPVQQQMVEGKGSQCGYCTPGFILSLLEGYHRDDMTSRQQWEDQLCGNLCRCTGYRPILDAALAAGAERKPGPLDDRLRAAPPLGRIQHEGAGGKFFRPCSLPELFDLLQQWPEGRLIAGATELGLDITKRFRQFPIFISLEAVAELRQLQKEDSAWRIGAAVTLTEIDDAMGAEIPAARDMLRVFGSRQIRNRATMGGNLVTASPIGDSAPLLLALDARLILASAGGERTLPIDEFFLGYRKTALQPGEILKTILIPRPAPSRTAWFKVSKRREMDISSVAACFSLTVDANNNVQRIRLAYGGVAATPARALQTEQALLNQPWTAASLAMAIPRLAADFKPISDVRGSAAYRAALTASLLQKFFCGEPAATRQFSPTPRAPESPPHESAHLHVTGAARYADDQAAHKNALETWPVCATVARAKILRREATEARLMPGIHAVLLAEDVPGVNDSSPNHDEILLAEKEAAFHGHLIALVAGESQEACRAAAEKIMVEYEPLAPILTLRDALAAQSFHNEPNFIRRGQIDAALAEAPNILEGEFELGGQEHFYLEMQAAWAEPGEDGTMFVSSSTQHPTEVQNLVAHALHLPVNKVVVQVPRMGGGFGGKETQAAAPAILAALAAAKTGRAVRVHWNRDQDMMLTGHRHPFLARFKVGFDSEGKFRGARIHLWSNGGWSRDLSPAVTDRALFHLDNSYYIPAVEFRGQVARTNLSSNTAFRGFGGPQGMLIIEEIIDRIARRLGLPPEIVRERNLYHGAGETNTTHYGQPIGDNTIPRVWAELKQNSAFDQRRAELARWNAASPHRKRGLAITPVKFGISFTLTHLNQAGAFVLIYQDGAVQVNHGGTEMGQGVHTNIRAIAAQALGVAPENIRVMPTSTDKVPNTSATAASVGTDINGAAVKNACETLRARLLPAACALLGSDSAEFAAGRVFDPSRPEKRISFHDVVQKAWQTRVSLSATGYYATPGITWDRAAGQGRPFHYFACGAAVAEVEVDGFTGMHRLLRADILHDIGEPINKGISRGQVEGGFAQGVGWLTSEELLWDDKGRLLTHSPDTYKIPAIGDMPEAFHVHFLKNSAPKNTVLGHKAVGEPPLMLAISVREALRDAIAAFHDSPGAIPLASPATPEAIWAAIGKTFFPV
ncbi:MAG TPA: xanthine dehydrogenase molybdopterin binding subunit [Verrucomicrobiae bacterium]|jgi:xanthine dehydrogenase molybdopterin binding subunit/xanthine dehydrogenase small subunit|nr:xanthine dehydrogenase molybdopterin binding subunit [Verrucomicrobiae bacterium]